MTDPYATLGVERSATPAQVRRAYHRRMRAVHPDTRHGDEEAAKAVNAAYALLSDPARRALHDSQRPTGKSSTAAAASMRGDCPYCGQDLAAVESIDEHIAGHAHAQVNGCEICNRWPVAEVSYSWVTAYIAWATTHNFSGRLCRHCARGEYRRMQARNLVFGWWSLLGFLKTIFHLVSNRQQLRRVSTLDPPRPIDPAMARTLEGRSVLFRSGIYAAVLAVPIAVVLALIIWVGTVA